MTEPVDFKQVSTSGLTSSPVAPALAGLRANEARYFWNKYKVPFTTFPAAAHPAVIAYVNAILAEKALTLTAAPLEVAQERVAGIVWTYVFYEDGLALNILYTEADGGKRAVGLKLAEGMAVPAALADKFKFAHQKSKLAGVIRGSYFVIKGTYTAPTL
ncbi:phage tail protein [Lacticaseibacillus daqingensis]|uniref:phage tail protein n=1 Tax=Lacticaseibacillus daqingensis TaxID=2486014 RepID=UPI000F7879B7|nr:phage tail protein [Lacticaseibacillus daqingensis]